MNIVRSSLKLGGFQGFSSMINFIALAFFARRLGPELLGIYFLFQSVKGGIKLVSNFGLRSAIEKKISEKENQGGVLITGLVLRTLLMLPFLFGIIIFKQKIIRYIGKEVVILLVIAIFLDEIAALVVNVLKGELRVGETAELQISHQLSWAIIGTVLVLAGFEVVALIYGSIIGSMLKAAWGFHKISISIGSFSMTQARELLAEAKFYLLPSMDSYLYNWLDVLIIGFFLSQSEVGAYEIAWRVAAILPLFSKALANSLFPQVSMWESSMNHNKIISVLPKTLTASYLIVIPGFFGIIALSSEILALIFGSEYVFVWPILIVLAAGKIFDATKAIVEPALTGIGRADLSTVAVAASGSSNLILNVALIWKYGLIGAAVSTVLATLLRTVVQYYYLQKSHPFVFPSREFTWLVFSSLLMALIVALINRIFTLDSALTLIYVSSFGAMVYFVSILLYSPLRYRIFTNIRNIL